jgi:hypothetical protein
MISNAAPGVSVFSLVLGLAFPLLFQMVIGQWKAIVKNIRPESWKLN